MCYLIKADDVSIPVSSVFEDSVAINMASSYQRDFFCVEIFKRTPSGNYVSLKNFAKKPRNSRKRKRR